MSPPSNRDLSMPDNLAESTTAAVPKTPLVAPSWGSEKNSPCPNWPSPGGHLMNTLFTVNEPIRDRASQQVPAIHYTESEGGDNAVKARNITPLIDLSVHRTGGTGAGTMETPQPPPKRIW